MIGTKIKSDEDGDEDRDKDGLESTFRQIVPGRE